MTRFATLADDASGRTSAVVEVIGARPKSQSYLWIGGLGDTGRMYASVTNANALRALAHRILRALGDEPLPTKAFIRLSTHPEAHLRSYIRTLEPVTPLSEQETS